MSELGDWIQRNWFEIGSLLVQAAMLAALVWYGSKMLRFLQAFFQYQDQFRQRISETISPAPQDDGGLSSALHATLRWLQEPWGRGGAGPFRRAIKWLQGPMGS